MASHLIPEKRMDKNGRWVTKYINPERLESNHQRNTKKRLRPGETTADLTVRECILAYPQMYQSRGDVLEQIFFVIGNGYEWQNGEVRNTDGGRMKPWTPAMELDDEYTNGDSALAEIMLSLAQDRIAEGERVVASVEEASLDYSRRKSGNSNQGMFPGATGEPYPVSKESLILNIPDDVKPEWRDEAEKFVKTILDEFPTYGGVHRPKLQGVANRRIIREMYGEDVVKDYRAALDAGVDVSALINGIEEGVDPQLLATVK